MFCNQCILQGEGNGGRRQRCRGSSHLHQAVAHQPQEQAAPVVLPHQRRVLRARHAGEVKHVNIRQAPVVEGKLQLGQAVVGGEVGGFFGIAKESIPVHILWGQEALDVCFVLWGWGEADWDVRGDVCPPPSCCATALSLSWKDFSCGTGNSCYSPYHPRAVQSNQHPQFASIPLSRLSAAHCYEIPGPDPALLTWRMTPFLSRLCFLAVMTK